MCHSHAKNKQKKKTITAFTKDAAGLFTITNYLLLNSHWKNILHLVNFKVMKSHKLSLEIM